MRYWPVYSEIRLKKLRDKGYLPYPQTPKSVVEDILQRYSKYKFRSPKKMESIAIAACKRYSRNFCNTFKNLNISHNNGDYKNGKPNASFVDLEVYEQIKNPCFPMSVKTNMGWVEVNKKQIDLSRFLESVLGDYSKVINCDLCGRVGSKKKVYSRLDVTGWDTEKKDNYLSKDCLCISCWNKVKPLAKSKKQCEETARLSRKLLKEIRKCQKSQQLES